MDLGEAADRCTPRSRPRSRPRSDLRLQSGTLPVRGVPGGATRLWSGSCLLGPGLAYLTVLFCWCRSALILSYSLSSSAGASAAWSTSLTLDNFARPSSRSTSGCCVDVAVASPGITTAAGAAHRLPHGVGHRPAAQALAHWCALILVVLPFWTNFLVRTYAWIVLLNSEGLSTALLQDLGSSTSR